MTARLKLLQRKIEARMAEGKSFEEAVAGYLLTEVEVEELRAATQLIERKEG